MAYSTTSKYVQLTSYLVMEYMYADQPNPETYNVNSGSTTVSYDKLINGIMVGTDNQPTNEVQIFNQNPQNYNTTHNTALNNVVKVSENSFIPLDPNYVVPYNDFNSKLTSTSDLPVTFSSNFAITYDTVRYHILAGYNLGNIDGLVLGIDFLDIDGSYVTFSQIFLDNGFSSQYILNPSPLTIGINSYDKYFEIKIPSLLYLNNQYISSPSPSLTPSALLSRSGRGFVVGSPMRIRAYQVLNTTLTNGYATYGVNLINILSLESEDPFRNIGAFIGPADTGDFFEFFATDNGGFIEDFILFQNSIGNQYYIQNEIRVLEQIGTALLQTSNFYTIQTGSYDVPNLYRPIIKNSGIASSFTLRYTMTLVNSADQSRLIRTASYTYNNPAKYGAYIAPLQLQNLPQVQKIYNKVANQPTITVPNPNPSTPRTIIKYTDVFFDRGLVNVTSTNLTVDGNNVTSSDSGAGSQTIYGKGKLYITVSPFDNYYKFNFYKQIPSGEIQIIDLESGRTYHMVFINNSSQKISVPSLTSKNIADSAKGELAFRLPETIANDVLQYTNRTFYITNNPPGSVEGDTLNSTGGTGPSSSTTVGSPLDTGILTVFSTSSSVLYWGNWLKDGENPPGTGATSAAGPTGGTTTSDGSGPRNTGTRSTGLSIGESSFSLVEPAAGSLEADLEIQSDFFPGSNATSGKSGTPVLPPAEFKSAITTTVTGMLLQDWQAITIINYFLNPSQPGYKLFSGITKEIFTEAVTSTGFTGATHLFTDAELALLRNYGNTGSGTTNGGSGSNAGSSTNQNASDNGSPNSNSRGGRSGPPNPVPGSYGPRR